MDLMKEIVTGIKNVFDRRQIILVAACLVLSSCYGGAAMAPYMLAAAGPHIAGYAAGQATSAQGENRIYFGTTREEVKEQKIAETQSPDLWAKVHVVIEPNGARSWMKDASWNEIVFTLKNAAAQDVVVDKIQMVNEQGVFVNQVELDELMQMSTRVGTESTKKYMGRYSYTNTLATSVGGMLLDMVVPGAGLALQGYQMGKDIHDTKTMMQESEDMERAIDEFRRRQVAQCSLAPGGALFGSAFFPPQRPRELRFSYTMKNGASRELVVSFTTIEAKSRM